jgi:uncharacterized iron-regulated membrane protein
MKLRTVVFWSHLTAGVTAGIVILIMSLTGVLLMYERQLIEWSDRGYARTAPAAGSQRLPVETLLARVTEQRPEHTPTTITLRADVTAPVAITLGQTTVYQDPYTGHILGEPSTDVRRVMTELRAWHRWLSLDGETRAIGKAVSGWSNLIFLFIVLSGMYLWIPRKWGWQNVRTVALFRRGLRSKARDFNWHNVIGIWSAVPLAIIVATATPISFPWASALVYRIAGEAPPPPATASRANGPGRQPSGVRTDGLNALWERAAAQVPGWRSINLRLSASADAPAVFAIDSGSGGQPQLRSTLTLDSVTGAVVRWEPFESQTRGRRLRSWTRFTHTGEYYGLAGQTLAGLASAGGVVLVCTGFALALRRFFGKSSTPERAASARRQTQNPSRREQPALPRAAARVAE